MSVRSEFARTLSDTIRCLHAADGPRARELARGLERARADANGDLSRAATSVLAEWEPSPADALPIDADTGTALIDAADRMVAIAKVILGR